MTPSTTGAGSDAAALPPGRPVLVWGNCQARPIAELITPAVDRAGAFVEPVPPVFEVSRNGLVQVQELVRRAAALITQPVRDEYRWPGCGANELAALLPPDARLVRFPVVYDVGPFPYQCNAHGADGVRVDAPFTDYHDLRAVVAADRGYDAARTTSWWPAPAAEAVRSIAAESRAELARRDTSVDVAGADLLGSGAMFTLSHPSNDVLAEIARRILVRLGIPGPVVAPQREFLGERRAPLEPAVAAALGWSGAAVGDHWLIRDEPLDLRDQVEAHLAFYAERPDVVADTMRRQAGRLSCLGL